MTFDEPTVAALKAPLDPRHIASREQSGQKLSYIEGWHAIAEANRIFGFDGWTRETDELKCVSERERKIGRNKDRDGWGVTYTCRVRIRVGNIMREGCGAGHGIDADPGQAHESAIKEAETDAMKRALMTFGNPFGLALYDKSHSNVGAPVIDDGQYAELVNLSQAADVAVGAICEQYKVPSLDKLPADKFESVAKRLRLTIESNNERKAA